jgi:hypothetical protein
LAALVLDIATTGNSAGATPMPFVKGQSGNPAGRPVGSRNRFTREMDEALQHSGPGLIGAIIGHVHDANPAAMRLCLDRLVPLGKHRPSAVQLPPADTPDYTMTALGEIHRALGAGEITTDEATRLLGFVERTTRILASKAVAQIDFADRLARCEEALLLLLGAGPVAASKAEPAPLVPEAAADGGVIANNNAETMTPVTAEAGRPVAAPAAERPSLATNNEITIAGTASPGAAVRAPAEARPRRRNGGAVDRLLESTSLAHLTGATSTTTMPPRMPLAGAA